MKLRSVMFVAMAGVSLLLLPASAFAAFCFNLTDTSTNTAVGQLRVAASSTGEDFTLLMGQFVHDAAFCPQGGGEGAPGVGQFAIPNGDLTKVNVSFATSGTTNCFPVTLNMKVNALGFPNMTATFIIDLEALAASISGTAVSPATCPLVQ